MMVDTLTRSPLGAAVSGTVSETPFLLVVTPQDPMLAHDLESVADWFAEKRGEIELCLAEHGAIRFRGFAVGSTADFAAAIDSYPPLAGDYAGGASPRAKLAERVFEATATAPDIPIVLHQEMTYLPRWPRKVAFYCQQAPESGGETIIGDVRRFEQAVDRRLSDAIRERGLTYTRNYRGPGDFPEGLSSVHRTWRQAFRTDDPKKAEADIDEMGMEHRWEADGSLTAFYHAEGFATHSVTGTRHWFNQLATLTFTPESLPTRWELYCEHYRDGRPKGYEIRFGDGGEIPLEQIRALYPLLDEVTVALPWRNGDVMLLDNIFSFHGRAPFTGRRDVQVSLLESGGV
jgi:alpha-ketoglutarate-dependent taurine dioxygenase